MTVIGYTYSMNIYTGTESTHDEVTLGERAKRRLAQQYKRKI
jgi:hypothetical protein